MNPYICLQADYLKETNVFVVCAECLLDIQCSKESFHIRVSQIEIDLDRGFVKPRLNFV